MAHWQKRKMQTREEIRNSTNAFESIENINEYQHLNLYQGDIQMDEDLERYLHMPVRSRTKRNAVRERKRLWKSRILPYRVPPYMSHIRKNLMIAIAEIQKHTCLRFVPYRPGIHRNYITFSNTNGCSSRIGLRYHSPGRQTISIGSGCNFAGTILHELLHAIGFFHEQARSDRDRYVEIKWENILKGFSDQFDKYSWITIDKLRKSYDFKSIMHYDRRAFTKNGKPTIVAIGDEKKEFGNKGDNLSAGDIIEINTLYHCTAKQYGWTRWSDFTPCDKKCYKERQRYCYHPSNVKYCGGNVNVYGIEKDRRKCTRYECLATNAIHGHWGRWSGWSSCSVQCDDGTRKRFRKCDNPAPGKYGRKCSGKSQEKSVCSARRCNLDFDDTDFDDPKRPLGMWRNKPGAQRKWTRHRYFTQTMQTGPSGDHTTGKGYYLYMESSGYGAKYKQAKLISPLLSFKPGGQCLKFYYNMYGRTMGSLQLKLTQYGRRPYTLFYKRGDQGNQWHLATATLGFPGKFQLEFIATVGDRGYSDIAIDDVYIDDGKCSCQDKYLACTKWSMKGECERNKKWMSDHCPRSCKNCGVITPCTNNNKHCDAWAKIGECSKNPKYMLVHCKKACKKCS